MIVDTHAHLIADDEVNYPTNLPPGAARPPELQQPMTAERLLVQMDRCGVERAVLVQRGSLYGFDNRYVCDSAERHPDRFVAVCAIDAAAADSPERVRFWVRDRGARGIRLMQLVKGPDMGWLHSPHALAAWREAHRLQTPVCVHLFPWNRRAGLEALSSIFTELPGIRVVIDHFSNMDVLAGPPDHGVDELLSGVARHSGAYVKFTTIPLGKLHASGVDAAPIVARVVSLFGAQRVMWGSDINQSPGEYGHMVALGRQAVRALSAEQQAWLMSGAAMTAYGAQWK
ncbi:MAG TPA: amidohydrolase family protein [Steroidobacteraceae bacterium]|nr:amidohydrolase family protein [Steroidobacteraceae bacterium]